MVQRCHDPKNQNFRHYGAKGVTVCERWRTFENFLADMGRRPNGMTLDRIDNAKGYESNNCRWATRLAQTRNRGMTRIVEFRGEARPLGEWAQILGMDYRALSSRLNTHRWSVERALSTAIATRRPRA